MSLPVIPVLLSGGRGTRLWPLSRRGRPKQLQPLLGSTSMLQATATRCDGIDGLQSPILVCGASHAEEAIGQLRAVGREPRVTITEPVGRNTAPAIAAAALVAPPDAVLAILPADHLVADVASFRAAMRVAVHAAADGALVTFGVNPSRPETGYGYIEAGGEPPTMTVERFREKPDLATARAYVEDGRHFWNSGMFVAQPPVVLDELRRHAPGIVEGVERALAGQESAVRAAGPEFGHLRSVAFDVAVMERTRRALMVPLDAGWNDVGSWRSLWEASDRDAEGNVAVGSAIAHDTRNSYLRSTGERTVVTLGVDDLVVVDTGDVVFVASMDRAQDVRDLVARIDRERPELG